MTPEIFDAACAIQNQLSTQTGDFPWQSNKTLWEAAQTSFRDVQSDISDAAPQLVQSGTGSGKTTFCIALIAATVAALDDYSTAYVVATIDEAQAVFNTLAGLLPPGSIAIHTSAHESEENAAGHSKAVRDHVTANGVSCRKNLARHRVIVCTHELWIKEGERSANFGVRHFNGKQRSNVFVDEFPDTITTMEIVPADLDDLADELNRVTGYRELSRLVRDAATTFRTQCEDRKARFGTANLISDEDRAKLETIDLTRLSDARDMPRLRRTLDVLKAAVSGQCFLSRSKARTSGQADGHMMLVAYGERFCPHPGLVILDATADLAPQVLAGQSFTRHSGPSISYRNLCLTHVEHPPGFDAIASRMATSDSIRTYVQWIKTTVKAQTDASETVLIVVPKKVAKAMEAGKPIPGRQVIVATWGMGVGSNAYRDCGVVFLFAEFHKPRHSYLSQSLASRGKAATHDDLRRANGAQCTGPVDTVAKAHRLRQFKQMACRGRVRHVDAGGVATPMRLYTTMDRALFLESYPALFPDAPQAAFIADETEAKRTATKRLASTLSKAMEPRKPITLAADSLTKATGIAGKDLKRAFQSKQCKPLHLYGWQFIPGNGRKSKPALRFEPVSFTVPGFGTINL